MSVGVQNQKNSTGLHLHWVCSAGKVKQAPEKLLLEMFFLEGKTHIFPEARLSLCSGADAAEAGEPVGYVSPAWVGSSSHRSARVILYTCLGLGPLLPWGGKGAKWPFLSIKMTLCAPPLSARALPASRRWSTQKHVSGAELGSLFPGHQLSFCSMDDPELRSQQFGLLFLCICVVGTE